MVHQKTYYRLWPGESLGVGYKFGSTIPSSHNKDGKQIGTEFTLFTFTNKMII